MAIAHCPTRRRSESASSATGSGAGACTFSTARSVLGSRPTSVAENFRESESRTVISRAFSMTWLFVKMYPFGSTMTPEPLARPSSRGRRRK